MCCFTCKVYNVASNNIHIHVASSSTHVHFTYIRMYIHIFHPSKIVAGKSLSMGNYGVYGEQSKKKTTRSHLIECVPTHFAHFVHSGSVVGVSFHSCSISFRLARCLMFSFINYGKQSSFEIRSYVPFYNVRQDEFDICVCVRWGHGTTVHHFDERRAEI